MYGKTINQHLDEFCSGSLVYCVLDLPMCLQMAETKMSNLQDIITYNI
jgi:hypothetical protein